MSIRKISFLIAHCIIFLTLFSLSGCMQPNRLEKIKQEGVLHVITLNAPGVYYEDRDGYAGMDYELVKRFADYLGVKLRIREADNLGEIFSVLDRDFTDIASAGLAVTPARKQKYAYSQAYMHVTQVVIYKMGSRRPRNIDDLIDKHIEVLSNSEHAEELSILRQEFPLLSWTERDDLETTDLLKRVADGDIDYTVVDSNVFAIHKAYFPKLKVAFPLIKDEPFAWFYPKDGDLSLNKEAEKFLTKIKADGTLLQLKERYYGHLDQLNYVGARTFIRHIKKRLPRYLPLFQKAAEQLGIDWRLLASISYQESHWRPQATSPTGVRGMMMLTQVTAREMGIRNRLNPTQSINGGAQYFDKTRNRIPSRIKNPDKTWMALAAYNIGLGHLEDARILAEKKGMKPDSWLDVQKVLPLLQKKKWYRQTKHGYARGSESVKYVQNIRRYYDVLTWMTQIEKQGVIAKEETQKNAPSPSNTTTIKDDHSSNQPSIDIKLPDPLQAPPPVL